MLSSGHSVSRKFVLSIQALYNVINLIASWFSIVSIIGEWLIGSDADDIILDLAKGNFYLFFVILSSSLESTDFHMYPIRYANSVVQVLSLPYRQAVFYLMYTSCYSTFWLPSSLPASYSLWATNHDRELSPTNCSLLAYIADSAKWKYKTVAIILAFLMVYLLFAAVECAIQAAKQGGTAYSIMWFSILVTYGGEPQYSFSRNSS